MPLKNQISFLRYIVLTVIHIALSFYYFGDENEFIYLVLFSTFIVNQAFLVFVVKSVVFDKPEDRDNLVILLFFALKFIVLIAGILYGFEYFKGQKLIIIGNYIFQLIILTLSIKRYSKKIKG